MSPRSGVPLNPPSQRTRRLFWGCVIGTSLLILLGWMLSLRGVLDGVGEYASYQVDEASEYLRTYVTEDHDEKDEQTRSLGKSIDQIKQALESEEQDYAE